MRAKLGWMIVGGFMAVLLLAGEASALVFNLNCVTSNGSPGCTVNGFNYGTITITDNANSVDITVDINGGTKFQDVLLNWDDANFPKAGTWGVTATPASGTVSPLSVAAGEDSFLSTPYDGYFDLLISTGGNWTEPVTITLSLSGVDLNPSDFAFTVDQCTGSGGSTVPCPSGFNEIFAAVHIQNCTGTNVPGCTALGGSINSAGSLSEGGGGEQQVPSPASVALLGAGLMAAAGMGGVWGFRRKR